MLVESKEEPSCTWSALRSTYGIMILVLIAILNEVSSSHAIGLLPFAAHLCDAPVLFPLAMVHLFSISLLAILASLTSAKPIVEQDVLVQPVHTMEGWSWSDCGETYFDILKRISHVLSSLRLPDRRHSVEINRPHSRSP